MLIKGTILWFTACLLRRLEEIVSFIIGNSNMAYTINLPDNLLKNSKSNLWLETVQVISIRMLWTRPATPPALKADVPSAVNTTQLMKRNPAVWQCYSMQVRRDLIHLLFEPSNYAIIWIIVLFLHNMCRKAWSTFGKLKYWHSW